MSNAPAATDTVATSAATAAAPASPTKPTGSTTGGGYDVARAHGTCAVTGQTIEPGEKLMAALRETPAGFERLDISMGAWPQFDRTGVLAFWQTVLPHPQQAKKKVFIDDQVLGELFERLADVSEPAKVNFRFVLGLILMRKRILAYEATRVENGSEVWSVRFRGRESMIDLVNPKLDEQQVAEVSQQMGEILNQEV